MFARITPFQLKPGTTDAAMAKADELKPKIMGLPGMQAFTVAADENGKGYTIAVGESRETSDGNMEQARAIWGEMAEFLAEMPTPEGYDRVRHWDN
ncbi:hypothetical protein GQ651_14820 [Alphaproteobacteria bacterium GH1-50]|uniref:Antibiotic biosynthesis monooxygenase n=1 Tax=Kangsaoukella pontilimi TaxID=2691042 RepID=A0A7C9N244_9RHOB|nr:hypothetical protein [Kangsaoukella pontilimi]MXQ09118.1 hypothetical protein [Kangsaoukella pontilimi]